MALIVGTLGDDRPLNDPDGESDAIFGDSAGMLNVLAGSDRDLRPWRRRRDRR